MAQVRDDMQNVSAHLLRPATGLQLQPAVASSQLAAQGQPAAAHQAAAGAHLQLSGTLSGMMDRFTDAERKQLAFSVLIAGASVLSGAQQQTTQKAAGGPESVQRGCGQLDFGSCSSRTSTPASLQAASMLESGHAYFASDVNGGSFSHVQAQQSGCHGQRVQGTMQAALEDSTSPLSSDSFALAGGVPTPCGVEAVSARVGCKRSYDAVEHQLQQQYQQLLLSHHQQQAVGHRQQPAGMVLAHPQQPTAHLLASQQQARQQQAVLLINQRHAAQQQAHLQKQAAMQQQQYGAAGQLQQQLVAQQQQQHQQMQTLLAAGQHTAAAAVQDAVAKAAAAAAAASRAYGAAASSAAHQRQLLLAPQKSGNSTSSGFSSIVAAAPAATSTFGAAAAASSIWQQLVQAQEQMCLLNHQLGSAATGAAAPGMHAQQQAAPLLGSTSSLTTSSSSTSSSGGNCPSTLESFLQQQQQQQQAKRQVQQQPPAKRAATQVAVGALLCASTAAAGQQQLAATHGSSSSLHTLALLAPSAAAPRRALAETTANRLLAWAGQVLSCQLQDAYHLAAHIFKRTAGRLDDMLLISLGASLPAASVTMLVSLWLATKLEGHRRQVAGCSKLAVALQLLPWAVTSIELHMMQLMDWQPYAGWPLRPQEPSCTALE